MGKNKTEKETNEQILETARNRFKIGFDADADSLKLHDEDMAFRAGDQWPEQIKQQREIDGRPCLTINKIPQHVHQITNDQRQNRPSIKVKPFDDVADPETAEVIQGIIRNIENNSGAEAAYDAAFDSAVTGGRGYFRITTDYCDEKSFDQEIRFRTIKDPSSVILDPSYREADGSDATWGFEFTDMLIDDFKAEFPDAEICQDSFNWQNHNLESWVTETHVRVAEYFTKKYVKDVLYRLEDGSNVLLSELEENEELSEEQKAEIKKGKSRNTVVEKVLWYKIVGNEILDETEWPSRYIPIIPVHGEELIVKGKKVLEGVIRHAKDPQKMYNFWATCETEAIALAPKTPYVGAEGQFEGHEDKWNTINSTSHSYVEYKPTILDNGQPAPPPQRQFGEPNVQAITNARMISGDDLKSTTGIYDASLGNRSNEISGKAIGRRTQQAQVGNFHFSDNLSKSVAHGGRIITEMIPVIYDTERMIRIIGPDDEQKIIRVNEQFRDESGNLKEFKLGLGKYDVFVTTGPSYASKRQEAVESMLSLTQSNPQIANIAGDLMVKNMDWPGADEIAERLKRTIDPKLLGEEQDPEIPPQAQAQIDQMQMMIEQLTANLEKANHAIDNKTIELESKERIEMAKIQKDLAIKAAELDARYAADPQELAILHSEITALKDRLELLDFDLPFDQDEIAQNLENELNSNLPGEMTPEITSNELMNGEQNE